MSRTNGFRRSAIALGFVGFAVLLGGCSREASESGPVVSVQAVRVTRSEIQLRIASDAVLYPLHEAAIVPKVSAPVLKFFVNRGDRVRAGQLLATLENRDLAAAVAENKGAFEQAQANYENTTASDLPEQIQKAELEVRSAKANLQASRQLYDSSKKLYEQGALARVQLNQAEVGLTQSQAQFQNAEQQLEKLQSVGKAAQSKAAQGQLAAAKGRYEGAQAQMGYSEVRSPIDGVVTDRPFYPGEMASSTSPLITVMNVSQVIARAHIPESQAQLLKVGDAADLAVPGAAASLRGKVTVVSPALDPNSTTVEVWVQAANPHGQLKPGSGIRLTIVAQAVKDALVIPSEALLTAQDGSTSVMVAQGDKPERRPVKTGIREGDTVQITGGLRSGEQVVTAGAYELSQEDPDVFKETTLQIVTPQKSEEDDKASGKDN
jgi:HlyD family secretion protein